ncbi:MAG: GGDEF domain-containing protein [Succinivibrionaceae bacterium]|nr:GGDEF domain-containing protein [Succinivibrionaceae bacterium]
MTSSSENKSEFEKSAAILKKALNLMVKNRIPATPNHYSVWYAFANKSNLDLLRELSDILASGFCTETKSRELYSKHIASASEKSLETVKKDLERMVCEMSSYITDTSSGTAMFQTKLSTSFEKLKKADSGELTIEETMSVMHEMVKNSKEVARTVEVFSRQLTKAQREISDLKDQILVFQKDASTDALTDLLNRRSFDLDLAAMTESDRPFSLIMCDIDHFKRLNDTYGHQVGDIALKMVARVFIENNRDNTASYRYGGEEIAMILQGTPVKVARQIADSMRRRIEKLTIIVKETGMKVSNVTASFGVAATDGGEAPEQVVKAADQQLYEAKRLGRNRVMPMSL